MSSQPSLSSKADKSRVIMTEEVDKYKTVSSDLASELKEAQQQLSQLQMKYELASQKLETHSQEIIQLAETFEDNLTAKQ